MRLMLTLALAGMITGEFRRQVGIVNRRSDFVAINPSVMATRKWKNAALQWLSRSRGVITDRKDAGLTREAGMTESAGIAGIAGLWLIKCRGVGCGGFFRGWFLPCGLVCGC